MLCGCTGIAEGALIKQYNSRHTGGGFIFTAMVSLFSMLFFVITDKGGFNFSFEILPYSFASGLFYCVASVLTFVAIGCGSFALSMLILSYSGIFSIVYGIFFLKDTVSSFTLIGVFLTFISIFLARETKRESDSGASFKWLVCILASVFGNGMFGVVQKMQQLKFNNEVTNEYMIISLAISTVILFIVGFAQNKKNIKNIFKHGIGYAAVAGISNGTTNFLYLITNTLVKLSVLSPTMAGVKIVLSFIYSITICKEKFSKQRFAAVIIGIVAIVILNLK
jgi:drug/metabolite transporter (DMT)-like permease